MKNNFANIVRFGGIDSNNYYQQNSLYSSLIAKIGDKWRILLPKADLKGSDYRFTNVSLLNPSNNAIVKNIGTLRLQEPELYSEIKLTVNSTPSTYKQFSLTREDGSSLFGTFRGQQQDLLEYIQAIKEHFESYPYTPIVCFQDGQLLTIRAYFSDSFHLEGEKISVGIGEVLEHNTNNPSIIVNSLGSITIPSKDSYLIRIDNVAVGNKFTIGSSSYVVTESDTVDTVKAFFYGDNTRYNVTAGSMAIASFEAGSTKQQNLVSPNVQADLLSSSSGLDHYKITVLGQFVAGNIIQIQATGKTTITYVVQSGDTKTGIEDVLNPDGGNEYHVTSGTIPIITVLTGTQSILNNNTPNFGLYDKQTFASYTIDRYAVLLNNNIVAGNVFNIGSDSYTVKDGDTIDNVLAYFGKSSTYFLVDVPTGTAFSAFAENGEKYTSNDIADVTIVQQPQNKKSTQLVAEINFNDVLKGNYKLALTNGTEIISIGNYIEVKEDIFNVFYHSETPLIEVANNGKCFDYDYIEPNLSQCVRFNLWVELPKQVINEDIVSLLDGGKTRGVTTIQQASDIVTETIPIGTRDALVQWLKHKDLIIDGVAYSCEGALQSWQPVNGYHKFQLTGSVIAQEEKDNRDKFLSTMPTENSYAKLVISSEVLGIETILVTGSETRYIVKETNILAGEYKLLFNVPKGRKVKVSYFRNGELLRNLILLEGINKDAEFLRFYPYDEVIIKIKEYNLDLTINEPNNEPLVAIDSVEYENEVISLPNENGFNEGFNNGFN
jgi:hypothetical protein